MQIYRERIFIMRSKYPRFITDAVLSRGLFSKRLIPTGVDFLRPGLSTVRNYCSHHEAWNVNSYFFPQTTFRGNRVSEYKNPFFHLQSSNENIKWGGMYQKEMDESTHKGLFGLIGKKAPKIYNEDGGTIETKETGELTVRRTTESLNKEFQFDNFSVQQNQIQLAIDLNNIPKDEIRYPNTNSLLNGLKKGSREIKTTLAAVHVSAILMRVVRSGFTLKVEYNPFYVDQHLLSKGLKDEYALLTKKFYSAVPLAMKKVDAPEVQEFRELQRDFYKKYSEEARLCESHIKAIESEISDPEKGLEHTSPRT